MTSVDDVPCFARLSDVKLPLDGVLLMTNPAVTDEVVQECARLHIPRVWMHRAGGRGGAVSTQAVKICKEHGVSVVPGECPYMFLPGEFWGHGVHGFIQKVIANIQNERNQIVG